MIEVVGLTKRFDKAKALADLNMFVKKGSIYGLVGANGAGKTTALKHIAGILKADSGMVKIDGQDVYENIKIKETVCFIPDELRFPGSSPKDSARLYSQLYKEWDWDAYKSLMADFSLNEKQKATRLSKGMQKQAAFALALAAKPDCLLLDEPIDGLDPLARKLVLKRIVENVAEREMTVLVSSHNLRDMEGLCDSIGILSKGSMRIERDLDELMSDLHKVQVAFHEQTPLENRYLDLDVLHSEKRGAVEVLIIRCPKERMDAVIGRLSPVLYDALPLSLEEIFIYEIGGGANALA
ncbi:MAG: ABC transporter ATP-binding protein [Clostridiales bacterium]|jgi:ABC-2 type transport system ATP-binding protein|nr:ABC transporter ATP-binding protein [Clostridiales bacterium]